MKKRKRLFWFIYPSFLMVTVFSLGAVLWYGADYGGRFYYQQKSADLEVRARMAALLLEDAPGSGDLASRAADVQRICSRIGAETATRITVISPAGEVVGDSEGKPGQMDNHGDRPEVRKAFEGRTGMSMRYSATLGQSLMYVAVPVVLARETVVVRAALPVTSMRQILRAGAVRMVVVAVIVVILASTASFVLSRRIVQPLEDLRKGAERFAAGDFEEKLPMPKWDEVGSLAGEMNRMAAQLDDRMRMIVRQRNEMEAVLASMVEGVLAVDADGKVISINQAASELMDCPREESAGKSIRAIVRNLSLQDFVTRTLRAAEPMEGQIILRERGEQFLQAHGTVLRDATGESIGALVVLNDVTSLKRLEEMRRDFVANASHEIRTPVTSIKGFVETLLDGALEDRGEAERFLRIIERHADRLNAIVTDLLSLSKIERDYERGEVSLADVELQSVIEEAMEVCLPKARAVKVAIEADCGGVTARANESLLIQAAVNLVDNAVKASDEGSTVHVECRRAGPHVVIDVRDEGSGISREHIPRLFERFYRADKTTSREGGGTGLGLAIVKHIVQVHGGVVTVKSELGRGSVFSLTLQAANERSGAGEGAGA